MATMQGIIAAQHPELVWPEHHALRAAIDQMAVLQIDRVRDVQTGQIIERSLPYKTYADALSDIGTSRDGGDTMLGGLIPASYMNERLPEDMQLQWVSATIVRLDNVDTREHRIWPVPAIAPVTDEWQVAFMQREQTELQAGFDNQDFTGIEYYVQTGYRDLSDALDAVREGFAYHDSDISPKIEVGVTIIAPAGNSVDDYEDDRPDALIAQDRARIQSAVAALAARHQAAQE